MMDEEQKKVTRRVAPRKIPVRPREEENEIKTEMIRGQGFLGWYESLPANTQIYYLKLIIGIILGIPMGLLYDYSVVAGNWFIMPILGVLIAILIVRYVLKIDETAASWVRVVLSGTITLFVAFILISSLTWMITSPTLSNVLSHISGAVISLLNI